MAGAANGISTTYIYIYIHTCYSTYDIDVELTVDSVVCQTLEVRSCLVSLVWCPLTSLVTSALTATLSTNYRLHL